MLVTFVLGLRVGERWGGDGTKTPFGLPFASTGQVLGRFGLYSVNNFV